MSHCGILYDFIHVALIATLHVPLITSFQPPLSTQHPFKRFLQVGLDSKDELVVN